MNTSFITSIQKTVSHTYICMVFAILLSLGGFFVSAVAAEASVQAWNATDWVLYDTITIDETHIDANLTDFPVYVDLADMSNQFWSTTPAGASLVGTDIRVTDSNNVELPRELVFASSTARTGELHFRANTISSPTDTVFKIWYNGTTTGNYAATSTFGARNVWTNGFIAVYHLQEDGSVTNYADSTSNGNTGNPQGIDAPDRVTGKLGSGLNTDGSPEGIIINDSSSFDWTVGGISGWLQTDTLTVDGTLGVRGAGGTAEMLLWFDEGVDDITCAATINSVFYNGSSGGTYTTRSTNQWLHGFCSWNGTSLTNYVNGVSNFNTSAPTGNLRNDPVQGGIAREAGGMRHLDGRVDEVRFHNVGRSAAWVKAEYQNQASTTNFYTVASVTPSEEAPTITLSGRLFENNGTTSITATNTITIASPTALGYALGSTLGPWSAASATGNDDEWYGIAHGNGLFVAVGGTSTADRVMTSPDGITWTARPAAGNDDFWQSVSYGNGLFVAVGYDGDRVMTSPDGITWTARPAAGDDDFWASITYGNGLFVAVGSGFPGFIDSVMTSPDGITWTARPAAGDDDSWASITYGNGLFVAIGNCSDFGYDCVMTSPDGITWTVRSAAGNNDSWNSVTYGNGLFVAVGTGPDRVMTSPDGITWTVRSAAGNNDTWSSVTYGNGLYVAVGIPGIDFGFGPGDNGVMTSPDGITWTTISAAGDNDAWLGVVFANNRFVAVGALGDRVMYADFPTESFNTLSTTTNSSGNFSFELPAYRSATTSTWATTTAAGNDDDWFGVTYGNGLFVAVGGDGLTQDRVMTSPDGITWTARSAAGNNDFWESITYGNGLFVAVGIAGGDVVMTSPDGITWTVRSAAGNNDDWKSITYGNGLFVAVGGISTQDRVMTSPDGITWTVRSAAGNNDFWQSVTYGNGLFVAVGSGPDVVMTSPDGITWTARSAASNNDTWNSIAFGNGLFVAVSSAGDRVMTSPDGITWTARSAAGDNDTWLDVTYGNHRFVTVGSGLDRVMYADVTPAFNETTPLTLFVDNATTTKATTLTYLNGSTTIAGIDLWRDTVRMDHSSTSGAVTVSAGTFYDATSDADILFTVVAGTTTIGTTTNFADLRIEPGTTFTPTNNLVLWGDLVQNGSVRLTNATTTFRGPGPVATGTLSGVNGFGAVVVDALSQGEVWIASSAAGDNDTWSSVTYGNSLFVAVGGGPDVVMTSPDGITWTTRSAAGNDDSWSSVTYGNGLFVAVGPNFGGGDVVMTSPDGITWTTRSAAGNNEVWTSVTYGNGLFVAVADAFVGGETMVMTSPDGITWTPRSAAGNDDTWTSVTYGNGLFVAVGAGGSGGSCGSTDCVMTSPDGITWTPRSAAGNDDFWVSVTFGNGLFVAIGYFGNDLVMTSPDGITWTPRSAAGNNDNWSSATYSDGLFVVVGFSSSEADHILMTASGDTLLLTTASTTNVTVIGGNNIEISQTLEVQGLFQNNGIISNAGTLVFSGPSATVVHGSSSIPHLGDVIINGVTTFTTAATTSDLFISSSGTLDLGSVIDIEGDLTQNGTIITTGSVINIVGTTTQALQGDFVNSDQIDLLRINKTMQWSTRSIAGNENEWNSVTYGNGLFVAVGGDFSTTNRVMTSPDGITWTTRSAGGSNDRWQSITYGNGLFVAVGNNFNRVMTSPDGVIWTVRSAAGNNDAWQGVTYGNGLFVAVSEFGDRVMTSPDGINWTARSAAGNNDSWYSVTYGNGLFVAVGSGPDRVMTSPDGINWTARSAAENNDIWQSITFASSLFVAVGHISGDRVMTSPDGITWNVRSAGGNDDNWQSVTYGNGLFVAIGNGGFGRDVVITSPDAITWTVRSAAGNNDSWTSVVFGNGQFVGVGLGSDYVMTSSGLNQTYMLSDAFIGDLQIVGGSLLETGSIVTIHGNYLNQGIFTASTSEVIFGGMGIQTATGTLSGTSSFNKLTLYNTSQNGTTSQSVIFGAPLTVTDTFTMSAGTSVAFLAGATTTIQNFYAVGAVNDFAYLRSTTSGTPWYLDIPGSQINVDFVDVKDSHASNTIIATNSIDSGNNINWDFGDVAIVGSSTIANHDATQVGNAFNFQNKTDESLFAFKLIPNSGTATVTSLTLTLSGISSITQSDFTNLRLVRDLDADARFDATDTLVGGLGSMSITQSTQTGTITFTDDFLATTTHNYLVVANFNAPSNGSIMNISLPRSGVVLVDANGTQEVFGSVNAIQHGRIANRGGGGGRSADIGGEAPPGAGVVTGGGAGPGEQIGNNPNFRRPTAHAGTWSTGQNAYDETDGTYATTNAANAATWQNHAFGVGTGNTIQGIEVRLEVSGTTAAGSITAELSWDGGASWTAGKATQTLTTSDVVVTLGGASDLWGRQSWTVSDFSDANFRLRLTGAPSTNTLRVDEIQVRVYNQATGGGSGGGGDI